MTKILRYFFLAFAGSCLLPSLRAADDGPIETLLTQYISPVSAPTWENRVVEGPYGTGEGIVCSSVYIDNAGVNYKVTIDGMTYYALSKCVRASSGNALTFPPVWKRVCDGWNGPAARYFYPAQTVLDRTHEFNFSGALTETALDVQVLSAQLDVRPDGAAYVQKVLVQKKYRIVFHPNGGEGTTVTQDYLDAGSLSPNSFSRHGYTFDGWSSRADGTGEHFADGEAVSDRSLTLYACWRPVAKTVTVYSGSVNGSVSPEGDKTFDYGSTCRVTAMPRDGYHFLYWTAGDEQVSTDNPYTFTVTDDVIVKAAFAANMYTILFEANGGSGSPPPAVTARYDASTILPENSLSNAGFVFAGWSTVRSGEGVIYAPGSHASLNLTTRAGDSVTLYAVWTAVRYALVLHRNDGTEATSSGSVVYGSVPDTVVPPVRDGYTFGGYWDGAFERCYIDAAGHGAVVWEVARGGELFAQWTPNAYSVRFWPNGPDVTGEIADQAFVYDVPQALSGNTFVRKGYRFLGWSRSPDGVVICTNGQTVKNLTTVPDARIDLYAVWERIVQRVTFDAGSGRVAENGERTFVVADRYVPGEPYGWLPVATNKETTADFAGWWTSDDLRTAVQATADSLVDSGVASLVARWKTRVPAQTCPVVFRTDAGADTSWTVTAEIGKAFGAYLPVPPVSADPAYSFFGWFDDADGRVTAETIVREGMVVTARWTLKAFNDLFDCPNLAFSTDATAGAAGWVADPAAGAARSGSFDRTSSARQVSRLQVWSERPGRLTFEWRVSCNNRGTWLVNYLMAAAGDIALTQDYVGEASLAGEVAWESVAPVTLRVEKAQKITWHYYRYGVPATAGREDAGWIRRLVWQPDPVVSGIDGWTSVPAVTNAMPSAVVETGGVNGWQRTDDPAVITATNAPAGASEWVSLSLTGPGILRFDWRVSCEPGYVDTNGVYRLCDYLGLFVDAATQPVLVCDGAASSAFTTCAYTNLSPARVTFRWRYVKDGDATAGADAAWLRNVSWQPLDPAAAGVTIAYTDAAGVARTVTVPTSWVDANGLLPEGSVDYRAAVTALSGKTGAGGKPLCYWHDYLAGTDPRSPEDVFRITSIGVTNGTVVLTWSPDLRDATPPRAYQVLGRETLGGEAAWAPTNAATRFFRVDVHMKEP
jgi:uncharacterized repeat protein (TIGR02543 family)